MLGVGMQNLSELSKKELIDLIYEHEKKEEFLQSTIDSMSDTVAVIKVDGTLMLADESLKDRIKKSHVQNISEPKCYEVYHDRSTPCKDPDHPCALQKVLETRKQNTILHKNVDDNGSVHYLEMIASPIFNKEQKIIGIVESTRDITSYVDVLESLKKEAKELSYKANYDCLTQLPNRILFTDRVKQAIKRAQREHHHLAVLFLDLDDFKQINDTLGHAAGDETLKELTRRIVPIIRQSDTFARMGGDEFTILLNNINDHEQIATLAQKIIDTINVPFELQDHCMQVSCSIGISVYQEGDEVTTMLTNADAAMYQAKKSGKNSYKFYEKSIT